MREVVIQFGGASRVLWFDARDGIEIKRALGKKPKRVLDEDILQPLPGEDGKPSNKVSSFEVDIHSLVVVLQRGISHDLNDPHRLKRLDAITYDCVVNWLTEYMEKGPLLPLALAVQDALYLSGVMGVPIDMEAEKKAKEPEPAAEGEEGKALSTTPSNGSPSA